MADDTTRPTPPPRICGACQQPTTTPIVVGVVHSMSGPGRTLYACPACAPRCPRPRAEPPMAALKEALRRGDEQR